MIYRLAGEADLPALAQLRWDFRSKPELPAGAMSEAEFLPGCLEFLRQSLASGRWAMWVAEDGGQIIAQAFVQVVPKMPDLLHFERGFGYVTNVYTRPEYRNQGIGAQLMEHLQAWALERGLEFLILWPSKRAVPFYNRAGYQPAGRILELRLLED
jgi:GNAT superfamily N-acetyltransferase